MLSGALHVVSGRPVANHALQYGRSRLNTCRADVAGDTLERVGQPLGEGAVATCEGLGDPIELEDLLVGELAKDLRVECPVSADTGQAVVRVDAGNRRENQLRRRTEK